MAINYRTHFAYRILAGVEDLQVAKATYLAACQRWPGTPITLRQGTRVIEDSRQTRQGTRVIEDSRQTRLV
jgi:hypothetical protein